MSIQIISNFNATAQVAYVRDEKHGEMLMSGSGEDIIDSIAEFAVQFTVKYADEMLKGEDPNETASEDSSITKRDEVVLNTANIIIREIQSKLIKDKVSRDLDNFPDSIKRILGNAMVDKFKEMCESMEDEDDE